jgi:putative membrane protein
MPMWGWMSGWAGLGMAVMLVTLLALVVMGAVVVVRLLGPRDEPSAGDRPAGLSAMEVLQDRFAKGEIDEEEFQRRRALLSP